jgi:cysteine-S-conjugate beta-lyase
MIYDFDRVIDRRHSDSVKWHYYGDALPLWVADMDFVSPEPVVRAMHERVEQGVYGYGAEPHELRDVVVERLARLYHWQVEPEAVLFLPGVVTGFNQACHAVTSPGDGVLIQTPAYPPFFSVPNNARLMLNEIELTRQSNGRYTIDFDAFEAAITDRTRIFILCNPHNPVGRVFRREELARMAEICLRHNVVICSDEIHCDLIFNGHRHVPIASLAPEIETQTITLIAPSKTFNMAGLGCSVAIVPNRQLRDKFKAAHAGLVPHVNVLGFVAALAAYRDGQEWLDQVLAYLEANRDWLYQAVNEQLPGVRMGKPEGTYLAWLDCREAGIPGNPFEFFLKEGQVALNDGVAFGKGGHGFVRLNFGCPRSILVEAIDRMQRAMAKVNKSGSACP